MKKRKTSIYILLILVLSVNCSVIFFSGQKTADHQVMLEVVGDTRARQLYVDGFEKLATREKIFAYYLTKAGIAGRDIFYDQNHQYALTIRDLCEEILLHAKNIDVNTYQKIRTYIHQIWMNCSQYYHYSKEKFVPIFTFNEFQRAAQLVAQNNAHFKLSENQTLSEYLFFLKPIMFDVDWQPMITVKNIATGEDIITASANNLYDDVTLAELNHWSQQGMEKYPSNSKIIKENGSIVEKVYRIGIPDSGIAAGMYTQQLSEVVKYLKLAALYADSIQVNIINNLIQFYKTGDSKYINNSTILWVKHNPRIDFLQGFIEVYTDPRGKKGSFENLVYLTDEEKTKILKELVELAPYYESKAPYPDKYKRTEFHTKPVAVAALLISGMGDAGPIPPAGINLPNDQYFRETYGSKNLIFTNVMGISGGNTYRGKIEFVRKFVYEFFHPADIEALKTVHEDAYFAMVSLHEIIGHGSGKKDPQLTGEPSDYLREYYATLEEARAELMALWNIHDPKLTNIGLVPDKEAANEIYRQYARNDLILLCMLENRDTIEQDHERARHLIVSYIRENSEAIDMVKIKGKLFIRVKSILKFKQAVGELLAEVTRIKAEGDYEAAKQLVQNHGIYFNKNWRDEMVARYKKVYKDEPIIKNAGFCMPILLPIKNKKGDIIDVRLKYLKDFEKEQLYYSGKIKI